MKILFLNEYASPVSGAEYSQKELARAIKAEIFSPKWLKNKSGKGVSPLWFNNPLYYFYSAWQISRKKFDLIHVHGKYILPGAIIAGWLTHKPVIITVRDFKFLCPLALCFTHQQPTCKFNYYLKNEIPEYQQRYGFVPRWRLILAKLWQYKLKWFLNRCQQVIAVSPQLAEIYKNNGVKKVTWIYNLPPEKNKLINNNNNIILSVGKLSYGKGTDVLIKVAQFLPESRFVFCGEINSSLTAEFSKNCQYLGRLSHSEALKQYAKAGVFCLLSRWPEPLSRAGLEALSFGLPIVVSNRGGNKELVNDNGYLVDPEKPEAVAKALIKALKNFRALSPKSLELLRTRFNRQQIIQKHLKLYQSFL